MLAIQKQTGKVYDCAVNILPCKIHHSGHVNASARHWDPKHGDDGKEQAYFRGRKLQGHVVELPQGYKGAVLEKSDRILPSSAKDEDDEDDEQFEEGVKILSQVASFDRLTVWGHESIPGTAEDTYIKGVDEWMAFAQAMNDQETKQ